MSDISQVFDVDDILTLSEDITDLKSSASEQWKCAYAPLSVSSTYRNRLFWALGFYYDYMESYENEDTVLIGL